MRCVYCNKHVVGNPNVVVIQGNGPAHNECYQKSLVQLNKREFAGLDLSTFEDTTLWELIDMARMELNARVPQQNNDEVVLF